MHLVNYAPLIKRPPFDDACTLSHPAPTGEDLRVDEQSAAAPSDASETAPATAPETSGTELASATPDETTPAETETIVEEAPAAEAHQVEGAAPVDDESRPSSSSCDDPAVVEGTAEPSVVEEPAAKLGGMRTVVVGEAEVEAQAAAQPEAEVVVVEEREETTGDGEFLIELVLNSVIWYVFRSLLLMVCAALLGWGGWGVGGISEW